MFGTQYFKAPRANTKQDKAFLNRENINKQINARMINNRLERQLQMRPGRY